MGGVGGADRGPGPSGSALAVLLGAALVLVATSAAPPELTAYALGEIAIGDGASVDRELRIHLEDAPVAPTRGTVRVHFQAAHGLGQAWTRDATIALIDPGAGSAAGNGSGAGSGSGSAAGSLASQDVSADRCRRGCDLTYIVRIQAGARVPPGALVRYEAAAVFTYDYSAPSPVPVPLTVELEGSVGGAPVASAWSVLAGLLFLGLGVGLGPRIDRRLAGWRRLPAYALVALGLLAVGRTVMPGMTGLLSPAPRPSLDQVPLPGLAIDPWSLGILGVVLVSLVAGIRRWDADGGRLLGTGAVLAVGIGGLWLAAMETGRVVISPVLLGVELGLLGGIGGLVIGQAWRTDARARRDRWWLVLATLSHGIVLAGLGFVVSDPLLVSPFSRDAVMELVPMLAMALLAIALRRWFAGKRGMLIALDAIIAAVGLLGLALYSSVGGLARGPARLEIETLAVWIAVVAALGGLVASFRQLAPEPQDPDPPVVSVAPRSTS